MLSVVFSVSVMIPNANMKLVIPNMDILLGLEVKPGLLLKSTYCSMHRPSLRKDNSQEDIDRGNVNHDIGTCDHMDSAMA
jgi:hypothetical protein